MFKLINSDTALKKVGAKRGRKKKSGVVDSISYIDEMEALLAPYVSEEEVDIFKA